MSSFIRSLRYWRHQLRNVLSVYANIIEICTDIIDICTGELNLA